MTQDEKLRLDRDDEDHDFVDQSKIDFDPDDGLYSGTAVDGTSEIAGPHMDNESGELTGLDELMESSDDDDAAPQREESVGRHREAGG
jgi:hypothetical protein